MSSTGVSEDMNQDEVDRAVKEAFYAASFVCNKYYDIPSGKKEEHKIIKSSLNDYDTDEIVLKAAEALYAEDVRTDAFINSLEIFADRINTQIINSKGIDVSFSKTVLWGEFVTQSLEPQDVEIYYDFDYNEFNADVMKERVRTALDMTISRANAVEMPPTGDYDVILSGDDVKNVFDYYEQRADGSMIYPKYSSFKTGTSIQGDKVNADKLNIKLVATQPYSDEGIPMKDRVLVSNGELKLITASSRFAHYLGIEATGNYSHVSVAAGSKSLKELRTGRYLEIMRCSGFEMDSFSGHFGSEIRLAFYHDGDTVIPVTGGSFAGSIFDVQSEMVFSKELQLEKDYDGPYAVKFKNIKVSGR